MCLFICMLVPTTILAWQHYQTITKRMKVIEEDIVDRKARKRVQHPADDREIRIFYVTF